MEDENICILLHDDECINNGACEGCNYNKKLKCNCKNCKFFGIKEKKKYWCFAPDLQKNKEKSLLEIKYEEINDRCCRYFKRKFK